MTAFEIVGLGEQAVDYLAAWEHQREVHARVVDGAAPDTVLLLEHPPTFTAGKRTDAHERPADPGGAPVIDVDRGGKITFHGPGQLVAYPIVRLPQHVLVVDFVRRMEEAMIATCAAYALNCDVDMSWYDRFVPCGISDAGVTSLSAELGRDVPVTEVLPVLQGELEQMLRWEDYTATPDYEARPEPGRAAVGGPRVEVLSRPGA